MATVPGSVTELEALLARLRGIHDAWLTLDAFERWGMHSDIDRDRAHREDARLDALQKETVAALVAKVKQLRSSEPASLEAWVGAHEELLRHFIAATAHDPAQTTPRGVAGEELLAWQQVRAGERDYVEENVGYLHVDRERYRATFGVDHMPGRVSAL